MPILGGYDYGSNRSAQKAEFIRKVMAKGASRAKAENLWLRSRR